MLRGIDEATASHDTMLLLYALLVQGFARAALGDSNGARASADAALQAAADLMEFFEAPGHAVVAVACQAADQNEAAQRAYSLSRQRGGLNRMMAGVFAFSALAPLACGDVATAAQWADEIVALCYGPAIPGGAHDPCASEAGPKGKWTRQNRTRKQR